MRYGARAGGVPWNTLRPVRIVANRTCGASSVLSGKMTGPCECGKGDSCFSIVVRPGLQPESGLEQS
jgi:hypothetical protein